jgi:hypothetical protein
MDLYNKAMTLLVHINLQGIDFELVSKHIYEATEKPKFESDYCTVYKKVLDTKLTFLVSKLSQTAYSEFGGKITTKFFDKFAKSIKKVKKMTDFGIAQIHLDVMGMSDFFVTHVGCIDKGEMNILLHLLETPVEKILTEYTSTVEKKNLDEFIWYLDMKNVVKSRSYLIDKFKKVY